MKILIRNRHGTIYPERGGYTGVIDLGYDGRGNRIRIKKKGRTKQQVKDRLIRAVDDLEAWHQDQRQLYGRRSRPRLA